MDNVCVCVPLGAHCRGASMTSLQKPEPNPDLTSTALAHQGVWGQLLSSSTSSQSLLYKDCHHKFIWMSTLWLTLFNKLFCDITALLDQLAIPCLVNGLPKGVDTSFTADVEPLTCQSPRLKSYQILKVSAVALWWIKNARRENEQNDLLESRARSWGDVIFIEGGGGGWFGDEMRINLASERRRA